MSTFFIATNIQVICRSGLTSKWRYWFQKSWHPHLTQKFRIFVLFISPVTTDIKRFGDGSDISRRNLRTGAKHGQSDRYKTVKTTGQQLLKSGLSVEWCEYSGRKSKKWRDQKSDQGGGNTVRKDYNFYKAEVNVLHTRHKVMRGNSLEKLVMTGMGESTRRNGRSKLRLSKDEVKGSKKLSL